MNHPIGGYKIVFEYANKFVQHGNKVSILFLNYESLKKRNIPNFLRRILINSFTRIEPSWFKLDPKIKKVSLTQKNWKSKLENPDIVIATGATTVKYTNDLFPNIKKGYLIQELETVFMSKDSLFKTYNYSGFINITISKWLFNLVKRHTNNPTYYVQNAIDLNIYKIFNSIKERNIFSVGMLYHEAPYKGTKYALEAIKVLKNKYPQLHVKMFGAYPPPNNLPNWVEYTQNATQDQTVDIYNSVSIFLNSPIKEGFGLTGLEAMACGATLVSTDYMGVKEYAINNKNALLSPIKDSKKLAENVSILIENNAQRIKLAENGYNSAQNFSWVNAYTKMKKIISDSD